MLTAFAELSNYKPQIRTRMVPRSRIQEARARLEGGRHRDAQSSL
jgi:hypothetical protein